MQMTALLRRAFVPDANDMPPRRYDLDWLRVLAFCVLILYHLGMLYVANWGYHVKSQYSSQSLESLMLLVNPWRMPLLWLVSGAAIRFVLAKVSLPRFIGLRSLRLLLPLLFALLVIIPPQLYYEMTQNGDLKMGYWPFYLEFLDSGSPLFSEYQAGIWPHIDVNHLWYLRELWTFSLILVLILPILNSSLVRASVDWVARRRGWLALLLTAVPVLLIELLIQDNRKEMGFLFLVYGYLIGWNPIIWQRLQAGAMSLLITGCMLYLALIGFYNLLYLPANGDSSGWPYLIGEIIHGMDRVVWLLAILGLGRRFLNRNFRKLAYLNEAVYPYYILHQTIIIIAGYELTQLNLGPVLEPVLVMVAVFGGCVLGFEIIRRFEVLRPLFGLKPARRYKLWVGRLGYVMATALVLPLGLEILL